MTLPDDDAFALANHREAGKDVLGREAGHVVAPADRKPIETDWSGMQDFDNCPPDYGKFYEQYRGFIYHLVWSMGVAPREMDEVVSEIITRFIERDSLGEFRPDWATRSAKGRSVFRSYLARFVVTYARGKHRNNVRFVKRYSLLCDAPVGDDSGARWIDQHDAERVEVDGLPSYGVEYAALVEALGEAVGSDVMDVVTGMVEESGRIKLKDLEERLGISARRARETRAALQLAAQRVLH